MKKIIPDLFNDPNKVRLSFIEYFISFIGLMSVNPFFGTVVNLYMIFFLFILLIIALHRKTTIIDKRIVVILGFAYLLIFIQYFIFGGFSLAGFYLPLSVFYIPFLIYKLIGIKFIYAFLDIMYAIVIFTTPLWLLQSTIPGIDSIFQSAIQIVFPYSFASVPRSLLLFTPAWSDIVFYAGFGIYRNSGLFHEPGAYGVFLVLALVLNTLIGYKLSSKRSIFFLFAAFTTVSTTAYLVLFIFLGTILLKSRANLFLKTFFIFIFFIFSFQLFSNQEFLKEKIIDQYQNQLYAVDFNLGIYSGQSGRFFAFLISMDNFLKYPLTGRGILFATSEKATGEMHIDTSYSYGFMGFFATYGFIFGILYMVLFWRGFLFIEKNFQSDKPLALTGFIVLNLALLTQVFFTSIPIVFLSILGLMANNERNQ